MTSNENEISNSGSSKTGIILGVMVLPIVVLFIIFFTVLDSFLADQGPLAELAIVFVSCGAWAVISNKIIEQRYGFKVFD